MSNNGLGLGRLFFGASLALAACNNSPPPADRGADPLVSAVKKVEPGTRAGSVSATITVNSCAHQNDQFSLEGSYSLSGVGARIIVREPETPPRTTYTDLVATPSAGSFSIPKESSPMLGANPVVWAQVLDGNDAPLGEETLLGRCGSSAFPATLRASATTTVRARVGRLECSTDGGPFLDAEASVDLPGLGVLFVLRNDEGTGPGRDSEIDSHIHATLIPSNSKLAFARRPISGQVGTNPFVAFQVTDGGGQPVGDELALGRCSNLLRRSGTEE